MKHREEFDGKEFDGLHVIYWKNQEAVDQNYVKRILVKANSFNPEITGKN